MTMGSKIPNPGVLKAIELSKKKGKKGSTHRLAEVCNVAQPTVIHWLYENIPAERALQIEEKLDVHRSELRPDLWPPDGRNA
jgi:DNA-binding transcriptional regulator YdaS (Cro superfamily)